MQISTKGNGNLVRVSGFSSCPVRVNGVILYSVQNFKLYSVLSFKTEPSSANKFHDHLTVQ